MTRAHASRGWSAALLALAIGVLGALALVQWWAA